MLEKLKLILIAKEIATWESKVKVER